ncbi:MAG: hypothetical protein AAF637_10030, partial [Pseudomonadota bacterium]
MVVSLGDSFVVIALLIFTTSMVQILLGASEGGSASILYRTILLAIYAVSGALAVSSGALSGIVKLCPMVVGILALPCLSVLWSVAPIETIERTVGFIGTLLFGLFLGWHYRLEDVIRRVAWAFLLGSSLSFVLIV